MSEPLTEAEHEELWRQRRRNRVAFVTVVHREGVPYGENGVEHASRLLQVGETAIHRMVLEHWHDNAPQHWNPEWVEFEAERIRKNMGLRKRMPTRPKVPKFRDGKQGSGLHLYRPGATPGPHAE